MSEPVIRAIKLAKRYRIGQRAAYETLRERLMRALRSPIDRLRGHAGGDGSSDILWALDGVSFEVRPGEVVGIIGRNGAGKSTLLKILSRITEPTRGELELRGRVGALLEVGTGFHPELTGRENIYLSGAVLGMKRAEIARKFDAIVAFAEVERFLDTQVKHYSTGMFTRLAFSVAAHLEPDILVVDEVLAVGDASFQRKCLNKMEDVGHEGRTVLFVSHNMPAVTRLCPRTILLDAGKVLGDGPSNEIVSAYLKSGLGTTAAREWPDLATAPGNAIARLCAVRVRNAAGQITDTTDIREPVHIEIEYWNSPSDHFPYANIQLFDENGTCVFASGDFTNRGWRHQPRQFAGTVRSTCTIPGNFLAEGRMTVLAALTTHNPTEVLAMERDAVAFLVVDRSKGDGARGEFVGSFPGIVRPLLDWTVETEPQGASSKGWE